MSQSAANIVNIVAEHISGKDVDRMSNHVIEINQVDRTLTQMLYLGRWHKAEGKKDTKTGNCKVIIKGISAHQPWYAYSCSQCNSIKEVVTAGEVMWCGNCEEICAQPLPRLHLQLDVSDSVTSVVVTVPHEIAEALVGNTASDLLRGAHVGESVHEVPQAIKLLLNTSHVMELKSPTYFDHGSHESFVCSRILNSCTNPQLGIIFAPEAKAVNQHSLGTSDQTMSSDSSNETKSFDSMNSGEGTSRLPLSAPPKQPKKRILFIISSDEE